MNLAYFLGAAVAAATLSGATLSSAAHAPVVHQVTMVAEGASFRFEPADLTIASGDVVRFVMTSGGPHNVAFDAATIPPAAAAALQASMPDQIQPLAGKLLSGAGESYSISFAGVAPGVYPYFCMPHVMMGMQGKITVR